MARHGSVILYCVWTVVISCVVAHLINAKQDEVAVNRFKLAYAAYNNALASTVDQMSGETGCYYSADPQSLMTLETVQSFIKGLPQT